MKPILAAMLAFILLNATAHAQDAQDATGGAGAAPASKGMSGGKHRGGAGAKTTEEKPKADDKDYHAAISRLPDQKFDPWRNTR
jgi:hypothetical protein